MTIVLFCEEGGVALLKNKHSILNDIISNGKRCKLKVEETQADGKPKLCCIERTKDPEYDKKLKMKILRVRCNMESGHFLNPD